MLARRKKDIQLKVFEKKDIQRIWNIVEKHHKRALESQHYSTIEMEIECEDDTSYSSEDDDLLLDGDILDTKRCMSVNIQHHDTDLNRRISILLRQEKFHKSYVEIRGETKAWVAASFDEINEYLDSVKPQDDRLAKYRDWITLIGSISVGFAIHSILEPTLFSWATPTLDRSIDRYMIEASVAIDSIRLQLKVILIFLMGIGLYLMGLPIFSWIMDWALKLWPSVEFDFGPEHKKLEKMKRTRLFTVGAFFFSSAISVLIEFLIS